ncbi:MAG: Gfo/Idh/MocA family oxidoreductase, partial [Deltaproteobacteria bacterium]|nr:Gfo/Idh/MocA family oxidoreductase [Deltaproteobacteria bacterium]
MIAVDLDANRVALAKSLGAELSFTLSHPQEHEPIMDATSGYGADAVVVCAASSSPDPMELAGKVARDRGRVVVVGTVKTEFDRGPYYMKELEVRLSRSYGPGRYDQDYEERGLVYPRPYVRFTETENMRVFLHLLASGKVKVEPLITHRFPFDRVLQAYQELESPSSKALGIVLEYPKEGYSFTTPISSRAPLPSTGRLRVSFIGAGNFARAVLLPAFAKHAVLRAVATGRGHTARAVAERFGFERAVDGAQAILDDPDTDVVVIATRHDSHARLVAEALVRGKHVFVEKPLAIDEEGIAQVEEALKQATDRVLHVGFNRRFAPMSRELREMRLQSPRPAFLAIRVSAGPLPPGHWLNDPLEGGGRLIGEGCHFVDLARFLIGHR